MEVEEVHKGRTSTKDNKNTSAYDMTSIQFRISACYDMSRIDEENVLQDILLKILNVFSFNHVCMCVCLFYQFFLMFSVFSSFPFQSFVIVTG